MAARDHKYSKESWSGGSDIRNQEIDLRRVDDSLMRGGDEARAFSVTLMCMCTARRGVSADPLSGLSP